MARPLRIEYEGAVYHVTSRGNSQGSIFFRDADRRAFLDILGEAVDHFEWLCHAYCLMTNHYHLLVETPNANLSRGMRHVNGVYTQWINRHHERTGHVFQGRFKSVLIEKESHLLEVARYIVLNPVRARVVRSPGGWRWSSYRATAGQGLIPSFLSVAWILAQFDPDPSRAVQAYRNFVREGRGLDIWKKLRNGSLLGTDGFVAKLAPLLKAYAESAEIPRRERLAGRPALDTLFSGVHDKASRNQQIHAAARVYGYTQKEVADVLGLHYSTVSVIIKKVAQAKKHQE